MVVYLDVYLEVYLEAGFVLQMWRFWCLIFERALELLLLLLGYYIQHRGVQKLLASKRAR